MAATAASATVPGRRRPVLRTIGLVVLAVVVVYAAFAVYLATRPVIISFDAVQKFRDALPKPAKPADAAWPAYRDALVSLGWERGSQKDPAVRDNLGNGPGQEGWPEISAWVDANQRGIVAARAASKQPMFGFPLAQERAGADAAFFPEDAGGSQPGMDNSDREQFPMFTVSLPHLGTLRGLANVFLADMFRAAEQGDGERATQDIEAAMALSIHVPEGRLLISDLVGIAIRAMTARDVLAMLEWKPEVFTDAQLARLQTALRSVPAALERIEVSSERLLFEDAVQRFFSDDGSGDGWFVPTWRQLKFLQEISTVSAGSKPSSSAQPWTFAAFVGASRPLGVWAIAGRKETLERHAAFMEGLKQVSNASPREALAASKALEAQFSLDRADPKAAARYFLQSVTLPALGRATVNFARDRAGREMACAAIAAERFRRANKRWPNSAAELAAFNGGTAPMDPWGEGPIKVAAGGPGYRMWSVSRNGTDDGGDPTQTLENEEGDWVFFAPTGKLDRIRN